MAQVWIPALMRDLTGGRQMVEVSGQTVGAVIEALEHAYPGIEARLCEGGRIRPVIAAYVDGRVAQLGLREPVTLNSEIQFLPVLSGG